MEFLLDFILHIDQYMIDIVQEYHTWAYVILFIIIYPDSRIFKQSHLEKTHEFYKKYGGKTIIIARFVPIVRTFAPFVAGMGKMHYYYFMVYNLIGGALWVGIFCYAGYFFGDLPFVQKNLKLLIVAIIVVSILPAVIEVGRNKWKTRHY